MPNTKSLMENVFAPVTMERTVFDRLGDEELGWACIAPVLLTVRGRDMTTKLQVYSKLTAGQQALFLFYAYYNHAKNSPNELYWWSAYFLAQAKSWSEIKSKLQYLGDDKMPRLLGEIEAVLRTRSHPRSMDSFDVSPDDLDDDPELLASLSTLNTTFHEVASLSVKRIGAYIREHPGEFVTFAS